MADKLTDFSFDNEESWFGGAPGGGETTEQVVKEVKGQTTGKSSSTTKIDETSSGGVREVSGTDEDDLGDVPNTKTPKAETSFFGIEEEDEIDAPKEKTKKDTKKVKPEVKKEDEEEDDDTEDDDTEDEVVEEKDKEEDDEKDEEETFTALAADLKERKDFFQNVEIKDGEKIGADKFFDLVDDEVEARVTETFEAFAENLDEDAKDFIRFKKNGGKTENFIKVIQNKVIDFDKFDVSDKKQVKKVLEHYYSVYEELDSEEVKDKLEWLEEGGKITSDAEKKVAKMKKAFEDEKAALIKQAEDSQKTKEESTKKFNESIVDTLGKTEAVGIIPITKNDQKELASYITRPTVKVGKNNYTPELVADLNRILAGKTKEDRELLLALAKSVKNKFDLKDVVTETTTKVVKKAKSNVLAAKSGIKSKSSSRGSSRNLADYFD